MVIVPECGVDPMNTPIHCIQFTSFDYSSIDTVIYSSFVQKAEHLRPGNCCKIAHLLLFKVPIWVEYDFYSGPGRVLVSWICVRYCFFTS